MSFLKTIEKLRRLPKDLTNSIKETKEDLIREIEKTHKAEQDPYNKPWKKRKEKYNHPINYKTGKLFKSYKSKLKPNGFQITNKAKYSGYVNKVRPLIPNKSEGLPKHWKLLIKTKIKQFIKQY